MVLKRTLHNENRYFTDMMDMTDMPLMTPLATNLIHSKV